MNKNLRVLFMGTPDFAVSSCRALMREYFLAGVVTQPDRPKGRGGKLSKPPVKILAESENIPCWQPDTLKDGALQPVLDQTRPDLIVVAAYGKILPSYILEYPRLGCINVHGSLLPKYRGAAPIQRAVINGERQTGVTIMQMARGMDTGDMILQVPMEIRAEDTAGTLFNRMAETGAEALLQAIERILDGTAVYTPQNEQEATYAPMIEKAEGLLDFHKSASEIKSLIMGLSPSPGAFVDLGTYRLKIYEAAAGGKNTSEAGKILSITRSGIEMACGDGNSIILKTVQKQGKNKTDAYSYACGAKLAVGGNLK